MNQNVTSRNQVGYKGVSPSRPGKYIAQITAEGKRVHLGTFTDPKEAAKAYNEAAKRIHGEFANLNIIEEELS
jgi:septum formation inhibitor-activating ATPase MinD